MKKPNKNEIFYSLNIEDIQTVAEQEIERELTMEEINQILDSVAEKINWYDAIAETINEHFQEEELH